MGIENIDSLKRERYNTLLTPSSGRAYIFLPDWDASTVRAAEFLFKKTIGNRSYSFHTPGGDWMFEVKPQKGDLLCFYNEKEPLTLRGEPLEHIFLEAVRRLKLMMVLEKKDCYDIVGVR